MGVVKVKSTVALSDQFFGWIFALGTGVRIVSPEDVVERFKEEIKEMANAYAARG